MDTLLSFLPPQVIGLLAFGAAFGLWFVRAMPRLVRISLIVPIIYFGIIYLMIAIIPLDTFYSVPLVRLGLFCIFTAIISNSLLVIYARRKGYIK